MAANNDEKIAAVLAAVKDRIFSLTITKKTGTYEVTVEVNMSQGAIGDVFIKNQARERVVIDRK